MELQVIQNRIYHIRGLNVMLDFDLAEMYDVQTKRLKEQVRRNIERLPPDLMFELTKNEWLELVAICDQLPNNLKHSTVTPFAFAQEGVAMLSGVLRSPTAIQVNISIMRAFVALRQYALGYSELNQKLETFMIETNMQFNEIYQALTELASQKEEENKPRKRIGYVKDE
ncbi:ORF6N domain-containing protein [Dysgonomonas sp. Marseille-P4677]|uniref:ORF6N domain-containing protein n=1 Tax=Dysgonomonas sp. Marseille-P4677 TaxID=2364790 RepID=UPI00191149A2|nr:ORF6N domain-containing protein [Dysgonomonas sp. Marseille-P4677]MBK5721441.1 ORF6N domain-containing protein [Dysgonomonas sp. Marseille-P4677]